MTPISEAERAPTRAPPKDESALIARLRGGDQDAFMELVDRHAASMLRVAQMYVPSRAVAEEVVQETWVAVLSGLERFEARSSLKTWIFTILTNRAKTRGERERRTVPFAALATAEIEEDFSAVDAERFLPADHDRAPHHWAAPPTRWEESPERSLASAEAVELVSAAITQLPDMQRAVITMRDIEEWSSVEVCNALEISETNQRVLLHRARSKVRGALEQYFDDS